MGCHGVKRTRKLCRAQQSSMTRSRMPSFHRRMRSLSRVGTVDPYGYGVSPSPNRTYAFRCIRLSILEFLVSVGETSEIALNLSPVRADSIRMSSHFLLGSLVLYPFPSSSVVR